MDINKELIFTCDKASKNIFNSRYEKLELQYCGISEKLWAKILVKIWMNYNIKEYL